MTRANQLSRREPIDGHQHDPLLQTPFYGVLRSLTRRSNRSRSAALIEIRSIFLIGADSQVRADL